MKRDGQPKRDYDVGKLIRDAWECYKRLKEKYDGKGKRGSG